MSDLVNKVVVLNTRTGPVYGRQSAPLVLLQDKTRPKLAGLLQAMFDQADDALFELADKASSNQEQNLYFESMRELRIKRRGIEKRFAENVSECFRRVFQPEVTTPEQSETSRSDVVAPFNQESESLSLIKPDELEELVALDSMIAKAMARYPLVLAQLTARIDNLVKSKVDSKHNPLGPSAICHAFLNACQGLDISIKAKLVFFKLFERHVVSQLGSILELGNQLLLAEGVLSHLGDLSVDTSLSDNSSSEGLLAESNYGKSNTAESNTVDVTPSAPLADDSQHLLETGRQVLSRQQLMNLLSQIQKNDADNLLESDASGGGAFVLANSKLPQPKDLDLMSELVTLLKRSYGGNAGLGKLDSDVIQLVQKMFQFILEDQNLADAMKSLISQLQVPMVKVALQDRSFFSKGGHPARKLLNEIATSALGWMPVDAGREDPYAETVVLVVRTLLDEFVDDISLFQQMFEEFKAFLEQDSRRSSLVEQRTIDAEDGRARAESAREQVKVLIEGRLLAHHKLQYPVPEVVCDLLHNAWSNVLFLRYLEAGEQGESSQAALATVDLLLWSVRPAECFASRSELLREVPALLKELREGLAGVGFNPFEMNKLFAELEAEHLKRIKLAGSADTGRSDPNTANADALSTATIVAGGDVNAAVDTPESAEAPLSASLLNQVNALTIGTWVEFVDADSRLRCRLAAKIKPTGKFIFVNRQGQKVEEHTLETLARLLDSGRVNFLDDGLLFDRALESVIGSLRK
jgi:hypothetical protein